jgi:hypothetical protein
MRQVVIGPLSSSWFDLLDRLFRDLRPLGHRLRSLPGGRFEIHVASCEDFEPETSDPKLRGHITQYDEAHHLVHAAFLPTQAAFIHEFEAANDDIFTQMPSFQPSAILPTLEIVDFTNPRHKAIIRYLCLYQSVMSRKRVGRQMGLFVWDEGQTGHRPLIGGAILASARWSQALRDHHLGWPRDFPKTSRYFSAAKRARRKKGLGRLMQLSVACALPPYNLLSGAWLVALAPFTHEGQNAFASCARKERDPDLVAVVTTTAKGPSGAPFRNHRIKQLVGAHAQGEGNIFDRAKPVDTIRPLRASFQSLLSNETLKRARTLYRRQNKGALRADIEKYAVRNMLRKFNLDEEVFLGNEIGVQIGMLSPSAKTYLRSGKSRPGAERLRLDWQNVTQIWLRKFLPDASSDQRDGHVGSRKRRAEAAVAYPAEKIRLSHRLSNLQDIQPLRVADLLSK